MNDTPNSQINSRKPISTVYYIFIVILGILPFLYGAYYLFYPHQVTVTKQDVISQLKSATEDNFDKTESRIWQIDCTDAQGCIKATQGDGSEINTLAIQHWLLAHYALSNNKEKIEESFANLRTVVAGPQHLGQLWPLAKAYNSSKLPYLGQYFIIYAAQFADIAAFAPDKMIENYTPAMGMVISSHLKALKEFNDLLVSGEAQRLFSQKPDAPFNLEKEKDDYFYAIYPWAAKWVNSADARSKVLAAVNVMARAAELSEERLLDSLLASPNTDARLFLAYSSKSTSHQGCWVAYSNELAYQVTKDPKHRLQAKSVIQTNKIDSGSLSDFAVSSVQSLLPCVLAMDSIGADDVLYKNAAANLTLQIIQSAFDAQQRSVCDGDGGILSDVPQRFGAICQNNQKMLSDFVLLEEVLSSSSIDQFNFYKTRL